MSGITKSVFLLSLCLYAVSGRHVLSKRQIPIGGLTDAVSGVESDLTGATGSVGDAVDKEAGQIPDVPDISGAESGVEVGVNNLGEGVDSATGQVNEVSEDLSSQISDLQDSLSGIQQQLDNIEEGLSSQVSGAAEDLPSGTGSATGNVGV